jgi:diguanylate cyclase (GGDEF)-like protein
MTLASIDTKIPLRGGSIRLLIIGGFCLIAAIAFGTTIMAGTFRQRALNSAERELENTVLLLARHLDQQFQDFVAIQQDLAAFIRTSGVDTAERFRSRMSGADIHAMLQAKLGSLSYVGDVNVFDADGNLINSSIGWPVPSINVADRPYFKTFKNDPQSPDVLVAPLFSRVSGVWTAVVARRITGPHGEFLGIIGRGFEPANFEVFFATVALGQDASISMIHRDGTMLARYPHSSNAVGHNFRNGPLLQPVLAAGGGTSGVFTSPISGEERVGAVKALDSFPIVVLASTPVATALADWRGQIWFLIAIGGSSVLVIAGLLLLVVRKLLQEHRLSQERLRLEKQRLDKAVDNMTQGLLLFDSSQRLVVCNDRYIEMYGLSADVIKPGCSFHDVIAHRKATGSFTGDADAYIARVLGDTGVRNTMVIQTPDRRSIHIVNEPLADGGWVATHEDITDRRHAEERIAHLAHYDALTDLPNRALFHEMLKRELMLATPEHQLAVFYIDIDEFKAVNDSLGHMVGDELLKLIAVNLSRCVGPAGFVARLGGDEFAIVQTAVQTAADVIGLVTRVHDTIRQPCECLGHQLMSDASIGIAIAPEHGKDYDEILKNADLAMYAAKSAGRRTYRFFRPDMDAAIKARRNLEVDLRQAITNGALEVYYQPCLSLQDDSVTTCEALVRWRHPERGAISPADFIPIAEDTGLINELGEWVLATACTEAANWPGNIRLAVNVSPVQFKSGTLALKIMSALAASGLPASRLELEITEAVLIRDDEAALAILHQLRAIGVRIALDDFGTGYSSLSYLQRFPFDKIKIDRCFVNDVAEPDGSSSRRSSISPRPAT